MVTFFLLSVDEISVHSGKFPSGTSSLIDDMKKLKDDSTFADGILVCEGKEIPVHRNVLATRSDVFKKMFSSQDFVEGIYF